MKSLLKLSGLFLVTMTLAGTARALSFELPCKWTMSESQPVGAPIYTVIKAVSKDKSGKWTSRYLLKVQPMNPTAQATTFVFVSAGSGDEDYNEYNVANPSAGLAISGAYIQNSFRWATLVDTNGVGSYDCRKN